MPEVKIDDFRVKNEPVLCKFQYMYTDVETFYYQLMHIMLKNTELLKILKLRSYMFRFT